MREKDTSNNSFIYTVQAKSKNVEGKELSPKTSDKSTIYTYITTIVFAGMLLAVLKKKSFRKTK